MSGYGGYDAFVIALDAGWPSALDKAVGGSGTDVARSVAIDSTGAVYVAGSLTARR